MLGGPGFQNLGARFFCALRSPTGSAPGLGLGEGRIQPAAIKSDDHFIVHDDGRRAWRIQLGELLKRLIVVSDVFGRETHALLRQVIHRALARRSAGGMVDDDVLGHGKLLPEIRGQKSEVGMRKWQLARLGTSS